MGREPPVQAGAECRERAVLPLHTIPTDCQDAARTLAREIESQVRPIRQAERIEAQRLLAQLGTKLRPAADGRPGKR